MSDFIEVTGESSYEEYPNVLVVDIDILVRAAKEEYARRDIRKISNTMLDQLLEFGLRKDELFFGGRESYTPWWKREKAGIETRNRITIKSSRPDVLYSSLERMDRYNEDRRIMVAINERQPMYEADDSVVTKAMEEACNNAKQKAAILAGSCGCSVGKTIEIIEAFRGQRGSGSYGDYDMGDYQGIAVAASAGPSSGYEDPAARLEGNRRTIYLKYRIKYELENR